MAELLILEFEAEEATKIYQDVNDVLGVDGQTGSGDWPNGLLLHVAGHEGHHLTVVELWESRADQEKFMESRLGPAFHQVQAPQPARVTWRPAIGHMQR